MKKLITTVIVALFVSAAAFSQDYSSSIGLRGGLGNGVTFKTFMSGTHAFEAIFSAFDESLYITGLLEIHNSTNVDRLNWYWGFGAHLGLADSWVGIGADGIIGIEYSLTEIPVNLGIDWKPAFNVIGGSSFHAGSGGVSIRYIIN